MFYTLENEKLLVSVSSLGATLTKFINKKTGIDVVLGFESEEEYLKNNGLYLGATVGRSANRTANGVFKLNGEEYHLPINNGPNSLHGGEGISFKQFDVVESDTTHIILKRELKDLEDGYPGNLTLTVKYSLNDDKLRIDYEGLSDKDTLFNITNHSYFNLNRNDESALNNEIKVYSNKVAKINDDTLALDDVFCVVGTGFDFTEFKQVGENLKLKEANFSNGGIDHNYLFENLEDKKLCTMKSNELELNLYSDLPGMQIYTANYFENQVGKYDEVYTQYYGVALEPQYFPNAINLDKYLKPIIKANEVTKHYIEYSLKEI